MARQYYQRRWQKRSRRYRKYKKFVCQVCHSCIAIKSRDQRRFKRRAWRRRNKKQFPKKKHNVTAVEPCSTVPVVTDDISSLNMEDLE